MMKRKCVLLVVLPVLVGGSSYFVALSSSGKSVSSRSPRASVTARIDLGIREKGRHDARFVITNVGQEPLELFDFHSSCACIAVWEDRPGANGQLERITLAPSESLSAVARLNVVAAQSNRFSAVVTVRSNDPLHPRIEVPITAEVQGGITASPAHLLLATLKRGHLLTLTLTIRDGGRKLPCTLSHVVSDQPDIVQVVSFERKDEPADPSDPRTGKIIGVVELKVVPPAQPQAISARLLVYEDGAHEPVVTIPVSGHLLPRIQLAPSTIVVPRFTGDGAVYSASLICRSTEDKPFRLSAEPVAGLLVRIPDGEEAKTSRVVNVEWDAGHMPAAGEFAKKTLILKAQLDDGEEVLTLPITCRRADDDT